MRCIAALAVAGAASAFYHPLAGSTAISTRRLRSSALTMEKGFGGGGDTKPSGKKKKKKPTVFKAPPGFQYSGVLRPGTISPKRSVPAEIMARAPDYAADGKPKGRGSMIPWQIEVKSPEEITLMRAAGRAAREVLDETGAAVRPGITTEELDIIAHNAAISRGCYPSPLNYHGFPKSVCTSVNEVCCVLVCGVW